MSLFALALVLGAAVLHATWNLLAKRAVADVPFLWLAYLVGAVVFAPFAVAILLIARPALGWPALAFVALASCLQILYFATLGAIAILGERPTPLAIAGALAIVAGALVLTGDPRALAASGAGRAVGFALATGVVIAAYTLWDKTAVSALLIPPLFYDWATVTGQSLLFAPLALRRREELRETWTRRRGAVIGVGILSRLAYILVLTALVVSPVSYVAPAREIGILFGAFLGVRVLAEGHVTRRGIGAAAMVLGVIALAVS